MKRFILIFMLATLTFAQDASRKTIRNFVTAKPTSVSETGLVLSYNMLLSGSQVVPDISGTGNDGDATNVDYTFKDMGFDGSSAINCGDVESANTMSWLFRIKFNDLSSTQRILDKYSTSGTGRSWRIYSSSSGSLSLQISSTGSNNEAQTSGDILLADVWYEMALTYDSGAYKFYLNGESQTVSDFTLTSIFDNATDVMVGDGTQSSPFNGQISEVNIYNIALTESQIVAKYNESIKLQLLETFSYSSDLASERNWIGGTGTYEVETVSTADLLSGWDFTSGWIPASATVINSNSFSSGATGGLFMDGILTLGKTYKITLEGSITSSGFQLRPGSNSSTIILSDFGTIFYTASGSSNDGLGFFIRNDDAGTTTITTLTIMEVTSPTITNGTQYFNCTSAGTIAIQSSTAYGTYEWDILKGADANATFVNFINDNTELSNGYQFRIRSTEGVSLERYDSGGNTSLFASATGTIIVGQWHHIAATRTIDGEFTVYLDDVLVVATSGTNPVTDNTYTSSNFIVLDLDIGDKVANFRITNGVVK